MAKSILVLERLKELFSYGIDNQTQTRHTEPLPSGFLHSRN